jgi:hypothetical protein
MRLKAVGRFFVLVAAGLLVHTAAQAQPISNRRNSTLDTRHSTFARLHPCGLIRVDPRTVPWMVQDTLNPPAPRRLSVSGDLSNQMPPVGDQGQQGSCAAWAVGYYQKTHYEKREHNWSDSTTNHQFSPAFIYNQINGGADQGSSTTTAFSLITDQGCATVADCPYNQNDYTTWPSESAYARAIPYRGGTSHWFWMTDTLGINKAKVRIDSGYTTVIGIEVYSNWDNIQNYGYKYCVADTYGGDRGSHAITIVGYNDTLSTNDGQGAFRIINSWGTYWGQSGYCWMSYVAARNAVLSHQVGYYLDDLIGYSPTMLGRVKITHSARDKIGIRLGVGRPSSPKWYKDFRSWRYPITDQAFPNHNLVFDMTEGEPYITNGQTDTVFVRAIDDVSDSKTGTINYFAATHLAWNATGVSSDTPVTIPDYNVGVYARARIIHNDVGVTQITAPTGTVDSGTTITPKARVKNFGSSNATFPVTFKIGSFYTNTQTVTNLAGGDSVLVSFTSWTATQRGTHATRCSTALSGDQNHTNDTLPGSVTVRVTNVGVTTIVAPTDTIDSGTAVTPQARVKNLGTAAATFPVTFRIGSFYSDSQNVTNLASGDSTLVSFGTWTAAQRGTQATRCSTALSGDQNHGNDTLSGSVFVRVKDVGVVSVNRPSGSYGQGDTVTPVATIRNYGNVATGCEAWMLLKDSTGALYYSDSVNVANLNPGSNLVVNAFRPCTLQMLGDWTAKCSTALSGDMHLDNDIMTRGFTVRPPWVEREPVPGPPSNRTVKDGAWLAYDSGSGLVYASKGNNASDFYSYSLDDNDWTELRAIPLGLEVKPPRQGACGVCDGSGFVYMAKGNNTLGFWRYDIATDSWLQLADVPVGSGRRVKGGSGAVYAQVGDSGFVYLLKGPTCEFYRFNVATGAWNEMPSAPAGSHAKWYDGSFLVFDGSHTIYAHKARYHELWAYDVSTATWDSTQLTGMPFVGRDAISRKSASGGTGAWCDGGIYVLKGGSTSEFWYYDATADTWTEFNQMPLDGSSGNHKVSAGGSMVIADRALFALKGNQTFEFWRDSLPSPQPPRSQVPREGVMAAQTTPGDRQLELIPNPLVSGFAVVRCNLPKGSRASLAIFDASGRLVQSPIVIRQSPFRLDLRSMPAGVYLVKVTTAGISTTHKLVVEH